MRNAKLFFAFALAVALIFLYLSISEVVLVNDSRNLAYSGKTADEMFEELLSKHDHLKDLLKTELVQDSGSTESVDVPVYDIIISKDKSVDNFGDFSFPVPDSGSNKKHSNLKYILQWTSNKTVPFVYMEQGQNVFIKRKCKYTNCYVTADRMFLEDFTLFDVIVFSGPQLNQFYRSPTSLPTKRSPHQKFVFASIESSDYYPVCLDMFNNFFNWTWTFRLDSESKWGYIVVRDSAGKIIGPKKDMHWMTLESMDPVSSELKTIFSKKTKAAAWFVSNCYSRSNREGFVKKLANELKKYELEIDIYGRCGTKQCSRDDEEKCDKIIETDYFFYLSFENSFSEDYVTEKLLHGLKYSAIPIVYGAANYTRFMPDGIYLNARDLGVERLAAKMHELIGDKEKYAEYFKWRNHYSYHSRSESVETDDYCGMCAILNDEKRVNERTVYQDFRKWWDPPNRCYAKKNT